VLEINSSNSLEKFDPSPMFDPKTIESLEFIRVQGFFGDLNFFLKNEDK
jgi:hypothetical protein